MSKKQKIWLVIFLSMFLIPEILWNSILNFYYQFFQSGDVYPIRENWLNNYDNYILLKTILFLQLFGVFASLLIIIAGRINKLIKTFLVILMLLLILIIGFSFLFTFYNNPHF